MTAARDCPPKAAGEKRSNQHLDVVGPRAAPASGVGTCIRERREEFDVWQLRHVNSRIAL
jgi:hypothetical protein